MCTCNCMYLYSDTVRMLLYCHVTCLLFGVFVLWNVVIVLCVSTCTKYLPTDVNTADI